MESDRDDSVVRLKKRGDNFFREGLFEEALKIYDSAIKKKKDESDLELLMCRAETYNKMEQYSSCVGDLLTITENCLKGSSLVFYRVFLMSQFTIRGLPVEPENCEKLVEIFRRAIDDPVAESARSNVVLNTLDQGYQKNTSSSAEAMYRGCINYSVGRRESAIEDFTKAIEYDRLNSLAYVFRAICFAKEADREQELISDVQKSIDLDHRYAYYLASTARDFLIGSKIIPCFRLIKALGASIETHKRSVERLFLELFDDKTMNNSERIHFNYLDASFSAPSFELMIRSIDSDSQSDSETDSSNNREEGEKNKRKPNERALKWKERGDKFYEKEQLKAALDCYNKAIELDKSNLELLVCRAQVYFDMDKWMRCIREADRLIALHKRQGENFQCEPVFRAWKLMGVCVMRQRGPNPVSLEVFTKALQIDAPANELGKVIVLHNLARNGWGDIEASEAAYEAGLRHARQDNNAEAIKQYTKAIEINHSAALIYAARAVCYVEYDYHERELISDVKKSLNLDYRVLNFLLVACISGFESRPTGRLRLLKALSLSEEAFKQSAGRIFPKILNNKPLNKYERKRFKELAGGWSEEQSCHRLI